MSEVVGSADKLKALCEERRDLRLEMIELQRGLQQTALLFITVAGVAATLYWSEKPLGDPTTRAYVIFCFSQVEVYLALFGTLLRANQRAHAVYIRELENRINATVGEPIALWETRASPSLIHRGVYLWCSLAFASFLVVLFFAFVILALAVVDRFVFGLIVAVELVAVIGLLLAVHLERGQGLGGINTTKPPASENETAQRQEP